MTTIMMVIWLNITVDVARDLYKLTLKIIQLIANVVIALSLKNVRTVVVKMISPQEAAYTALKY
jgi:hypothetical protein